MIWHRIQAAKKGGDSHVFPLDLPAIVTNLGRNYFQDLRFCLTTSRVHHRMAIFLETGMGKVRLTNITPSPVASEFPVKSLGRWFHALNLMWPLTVYEMLTSNDLYGEGALEKTIYTPKG